MGHTSQRPRHAHLVGVGGAGMSALARLLHETGVTVTGSDAVASSTLDGLSAAGLTVWSGPQPRRLRGYGGWLVRSAAVSADDPEVRACVSRGFSSMLYAEAVGLLSREMRTLAVAGAHGKTSTTAMLAAALRGGGVDASHLVGGDVPTLGGGGHGGTTDCLAVEACEFNRSFHQLTPTAAAVINIDHDHFDCYPTHDELLMAYAGFVARVRSGGLLVLPANAPKSLLDSLGSDVQVRCVGWEPGVDDWPAEPRQEAGCWSFGPVIAGRALPRLRLAVPGKFQIQNALFALDLALFAGADVAGALDGLARFSGVRRRFEVRRARSGVTVIDDYAHHPTEIAAVVAAARSRFPGRRLIAAFQPHQHQRTAALLTQFAAELSRLDECLVMDIYAARETAEHCAKVSAADLVNAVRACGGRCNAGGALADLPERVAEVCSEGDVVMMLGAGDIEQVVDDVIELL